MSLGKKAFTLSEVLITLAVIGVVAAMTIPGLITKSRQKQFDTQFKKAFSTLQQANRMSQTEYEWTFSDINSPCGENPATEKPTEKMSLCALFNGTLKGQTYLGKLENLKDKNGKSYYDSSIGDFIAYAFADGAIVAFSPAINSTIAYNNRIFVDVNGTSLPNNGLSQGYLELLGLFIQPAYAINRAGDDAAGLQVSNKKSSLVDCYQLYFINGELRTLETGGGEQQVLKLLQ